MNKPVPKLLLFLSADVHNSTAFKNDPKHDGSVQGWLVTFKTFYSRFPTALARKCASLNVSSPILWKLLGDELIFVVELKSSGDSVQYVQSLREAIIQYNADWKRKNVGLAIKGTAWIAHFPVFNAEIKIEEPHDQNKFRTDYIGPAMDIGFRLAKLATRRKLIVGADLALLLLHTSNDLRLYFDGKETLKGVLRDQPYPVIWADMHEEGKGSTEDVLRGNSPPANKLKKYCETFIGEMKEVMALPFIEGDHDFNKKPADWKTRFDRVCKAMQEEESEPLIQSTRAVKKKTPRKADSDAFLKLAVSQFLSANIKSIKPG